MDLIDLTFLIRELGIMALHRVAISIKWNVLDRINREPLTVRSRTVILRWAWNRDKTGGPFKISAISQAAKTLPDTF